SKGGNTITVTDTVANPSGVETSVTSGNGVDTVNVQRTTGPLQVSGVKGLDTVNVGLNNSMQSINGRLSVDNFDGFTTLKLNDQAAPVARGVTLDRDDFTGTIAGLAPATVRYGAASLAALIIKGGPGGNTFTVGNTPFNDAGDVTALIDAGAGPDTI